MAFNNFVQINDGTNTLKYKTALRSWRYATNRPSTARVLLNGDIDVTYGPSKIYHWEGEILCPAGTPAAGWGNIDDLRVQLGRDVVFQFTDHYGDTYTTASIQGPFEEESIAPDWDVESNDILVKIKVVAA